MNSVLLGLYSLGISAIARNATAFVQPNTWMPIQAAPSIYN